jgi:Mg-chelatase subunit ChlD
VQPTITPTPTATRAWYKIYIPIVYNNACFKRYTDVALVIDASTTMLRKNEEGRLKLDAAKAAARQFLDHLSLTPDRDGRHDQASVVWFNDTAVVEQGLTHDLRALDAALGRIAPVEGSRIDLGLRAGHEAVMSDRHKVENRPVMVVLTDGIPNRTTFEAMFAAADEAKVAGVLIYAVGHGLDVEAWALRRIASDEGKYTYSPTDADLTDIYNAIAGQVICR